MVLAAVLLSAAPAEAARFMWQNPATHPRVIMNADQTLLDYMEGNPGWFSQDFLVTSFYITDVEYGHTGPARNKYAEIRRRLWQSNINFGTYVSGTTAIPELALTNFPPEVVSIEDMSLKTRFTANWIRDPRQKVVDLRDFESLKELDFGIAALWKRQPAVIRFIDNAAIHPQVYHLMPWESYCLNIKFLRQYSDSQGTVSIFNVFVRPWELTEKETFQLADAVASPTGMNAISFPLAWSRLIKDDAAKNNWAIHRYRQFLDAGIVIILIPSAEADAYELTNWLAKWRRPTDRVYIAAPYTQPPP